MKRPATASAGLNFLKQGYSIELAAPGVGAFLRYCERNNPGLKLDVTFENDMAFIQPLSATAQVPAWPDNRKAGLENEDLPTVDNFLRAGLKTVD